VCNRLEPVETSAKKIPGTRGQPKINQTQHTQVLADLPTVPAFALRFGVAGIGANRKRSFFFVKHVRIIAQKMKR
jgi:hypothetical protein